MVKLYFKYDAKTRENMTDSNVLAMLDKYPCSRDGKRIRVIVRDDNFESPVVQLAERQEDIYEPWKSDYWLVAATTWDGTFVPDDTWEMILVQED
jgi:hypothetical protein